MVIITRGSFPSDEGLPQQSTTKNGPLEEFCEADVLISLIDGVETRQQCESPWHHIHITSEQHLKYLCDFHNAFMDFAIAQDDTGGEPMKHYWVNERLRPRGQITYDLLQAESKAQAVRLYRQRHPD